MSLRFIGYTATEYDSKAAVRGSLEQVVVDNDDEDRGWYFTGVVETPHGYVAVYSQGLDGIQASSSTYRVVHNGRTYTRSEQRAREKRSLVTEAVRFAKRVALANGGDR